MGRPGAIVRKNYIMDTAIATLVLPNRVKPATVTIGLQDELKRMDAYWRAANYLSVGQICLYDNPLLPERC